MKILVVNEWHRVIGGIESYLSRAVPLLQNHGYDIALLCEHEGDQSRSSILECSTVHTWIIDQIGKDAALEAVLRFAPDLLFVHGIEDIDLEEKLLSVAPAIRFIHVFRGTCISSEKMRKFPVPIPCNKKFGPGCLVNYLPRRCGGLNPRTMFQRYQTESTRLKLLRRYVNVLCASSYMANEISRHGVPSTFINLFVTRDLKSIASTPIVEPVPSEGKSWNLAFIGRMEFLKGGHLLIEALAQIRTKGTFAVTFVGDGRESQRWRALAERVLKPIGINYLFTGWLSKDKVDSLLESTHLLVMPSIWPEPFGLTGIEAGLQSVPAVAFDVGGIGDWLRDGTNGCLATGNPPSAQSLATAITGAVSNSDFYLRLRDGARRMAESFDQQTHTARIVEIFEDAVRQRKKDINGVFVEKQ